MSKCNCNLIQPAPPLKSLTFTGVTTTTASGVVIGANWEVIGTILNAQTKPPASLNGNEALPEIFGKFVAHQPINFGKMIISTNKAANFEQPFKVITLNHGLNYKLEALNLNAGCNNLIKNELMRSFIVDLKLNAATSIVLSLPAYTTYNVTLIPTEYTTN